MISYFQAQRLALQAGVPVEIIEKDYLIELLLFYSSRDEYLNETMIFRGGTALKKIYFPEYRFSEDLDFLVNNDADLTRIEQRVNNVLIQISSGYPFQLTHEPGVKKDRFQSFILYDIIPDIKTDKKLKLEIVKDSVIPGSQIRNILFSYQEFKGEPLSIKAYNLESVVSDKISRILSVDNEARDVYDLWCLLKQRLNSNIVKDELKNRFGHDIYLPGIMDSIKREEYRINWKIRLEKQIANLPDFDIVINGLAELIKKQLLNQLEPF